MKNFYNSLFSQYIHFNIVSDVTNLLTENKLTFSYDQYKWKKRHCNNIDQHSSLVIKWSIHAGYFDTCIHIQEVVMVIGVEGMIVYGKCNVRNTILKCTIPPRQLRSFVLLCIFLKYHSYTFVTYKKEQYSLWLPNF